MGTSQSTTNKLSFEDVQYIIAKPNGFLLVNTIPENEQLCLIHRSVLATEEENIINNCLQTRMTGMYIIVYGKNANDHTIYTKHAQLLKMGFSNVYMYAGGLFEWLLLQDIYGTEEFPTTSKELDILKYKPRRAIHTNLIGY